MVLLAKLPAEIVSSERCTRAVRTGILEPNRPHSFGTEIYDTRGTLKVDRLLYMIIGDLALHFGEYGK